MGRIRDPPGRDATNKTSTTGRIEEKMTTMRTTPSTWLSDLGDTLITAAWLVLGIVLWLIVGNPPEKAAAATAQSAPTPVAVRHHSGSRRSQSHSPVVERALQAALRQAEPGDWAPLERAHFDPHWMVERVN
jgi:hypothetical protein